MPVVTTTGGPTVSTRAKLIEKVVRLYGLDATDPDFNTVALDGLDEACNELNAFLFDWNLQSQTGITLTEGQQSYTITSQFYKENLAYLEKISDGADIAPLRYLPWQTFKKMYPDDTMKGGPSVYSAFNFQSNSLIYLSAVPDATVASDYHLTVEYFRRTPLISSVDTGINPDIPAEAEPFLTARGQRAIATHLMGAGHPDVSGLLTLEQRALDRLRQIDKIHPDGDFRFRVIDGPTAGVARARKYGTYIRID